MYACVYYNGILHCVLWQHLCNVHTCTCTAREDLHLKQSNFNSKVLDAGEDKVYIYTAHILILHPL